jgi:hypothetical protein
MGGFAFFCRYDVLSRLRVNIFFSLSLSLSLSALNLTLQKVIQREAWHIFTAVSYLVINGFQANEHQIHDS